MYVVHGPISMRRMKSMGQEALSFLWACDVCTGVSAVTNWYLLANI